MHELNLRVTVNGTITIEQLTDLSNSLHTTVNNYINHLPVEQFELMFNPDDVFEKMIPVKK